MKKVIIIAITLLFVMYYISLYPLIDINKKIEIEEEKIKNAKSVDLSSLEINGINYLENSDKLGIEFVDLYKRRKENINPRDEVSIRGIVFLSTKEIFDYLGEMYIINDISFRGYQNCDAYVDKINDIMLLIKRDIDGEYAWIVIKNVEVDEFYNEPLFIYGPLVLSAPFYSFEHIGVNSYRYVGFCYPLVDRLVFPLYYLALLLPFVMIRVKQNYINRQVIKGWIAINIIIILIAILFYLFGLYLSRHG